MITDSNGDSYDCCRCPKCGRDNYIAMGDLNDCTSSMGDSPACVCWHCKHKFWRPGWNDDLMHLECMGHWDTEKSEEENLKEVDAEDGEPSLNCDKEEDEFLESQFDDKTTWRGFLLERLKYSNNGIDIWTLPRKERECVINNYIKNAGQDEDLLRDLIAKEFNKREDLDCRTFTAQIKKNGGLKKGKTDWVIYRRKLYELFQIIFPSDQLDWDTTK
jgi:hypothetical protein